MKLNILIQPAYIYDLDTFLDVAKKAVIKLVDFPPDFPNRRAHLHSTIRLAALLEKPIPLWVRHDMTAAIIEKSEQIMWYGMEANKKVYRFVTGKKLTRICLETRPSRSGQVTKSIMRRARKIEKQRSCDLDTAIYYAIMDVNDKREEQFEAQAKQKLKEVKQWILDRGFIEGKVQAVNVNVVEVEELW